MSGPDPHQPEQEAVTWHLCFGRGGDPDHVDDHHTSIEGSEERCSRCGGPTLEVVSLSRLEAAEAERDEAIGKCFTVQEAHAATVRELEKAETDLEAAEEALRQCEEAADG